MTEVNQLMNEFKEQSQCLSDFYKFLSTNIKYNSEFGVMTKELENMILNIDDSLNKMQADSLKLQWASKDGNLEDITDILGQNKDIDAIHHMMLAAENGHVNIVEYYIRAGVNVDSEDSVALIMASRNNQLDIVKLLVENYANINARKSGSLQWAVYNNNYNMVVYLVKHGAIISDYVLDIARQKSSTKILNYLLQ